MPTTEFTSFYDILEFANAQVETLLEESFTEIKPEDCGLDNRTAYKLWIGDDGIVIRCRAGKHRAGAGDGEEAVSGGGIRTEVQAADEIIALIDEGRSAAVED